jgi:hypothetical protein
LGVISPEEWSEARKAAEAVLTEIRTKIPASAVTLIEAAEKADVRAFAVRERREAKAVAAVHAEEKRSKRTEGREVRELVQSLGYVQFKRTACESLGLPIDGPVSELNMRLYLADLEDLKRIVPFLAAGAAAKAADKAKGKRKHATAKDNVVSRECSGSDEEDESEQSDDDKQAAKKVRVAPVAASAAPTRQQKALGRGRGRSQAGPGRPPNTTQGRE